MFSMMRDEQQAAKRERTHVKAHCYLGRKEAERTHTDTPTHPPHTHTHTHTHY